MLQTIIGTDIDLLSVIRLILITWAQYYVGDRGTTPYPNIYPVTT